MPMNQLPAQSPEIAELVHSRHLEYPIETKAQFIAQMTRSEEPVVWRGVPYDPAFGGNLVPAFFFPITSEDDLIAKATELIISRGLYPVLGQPSVP